MKFSVGIQNLHSATHIKNECVFNEGLIETYGQIFNQQHRKHSLYNRSSYVLMFLLSRFNESKIVCFEI